MNTKKLEIGGKTYTFTARRSLAKTLMQISPSVLQLNRDKDEKISNSKDEELAVNFGLDLYDNLNVLFYEMIKVAHPMEQEASNKIFEICCEEYGEDQLFDKLVEFALSVFPQGKQAPKRTINW